MSFDSSRHFLHAVAVLSVDLHGEDSDLHLAQWRIDLIDHRADFVDAANRATQLQQSLADDAD